MLGKSELVKAATEDIQLKPNVTFEHAGQFWNTWKVRYEGQEIATCYIRPEIKFDSKGLGKLFVIEKELEV